MTTINDAGAAVNWRYSVNFGPDGEENWANVYDDLGQFVGNLRIHHAKRIVALATSPHIVPAETVDAETLDETYQEAYQEGYDEGKSDWKGVKAQLWNAMQTWLSRRHGLTSDGEGNTVHDLLDGLADVESENKLARELLCKANQRADEAEAHLRSSVEAARREGIEDLLRPRHIGEYHEDVGNVLWWHYPVEEPPYVGTTNDVNFDADWHQWWTPLPDPTGSRIEAAIRALSPPTTGGGEDEPVAPGS